MDARDELRLLLAGCARCKSAFDDNVALLVADDNAALTDAQVDAVLAHLRSEHQEQQHVL